MFLEINQLQLGRVPVRETFAPGALEFYDPQLKQVAPIRVEGSAELSEALLEIRVKGHLATEMEIACDRCLEPANFPIDADFDLIYRPEAASPEGDEVAIGGKEVEIGFYRDPGLELADVVREQVLLLLPMQRVCSENCKGICPVCGQNRNLAACSCRQELSDDRWSGLRNL
jgi:uncharacterized protein